MPTPTYTLIDSRTLTSSTSSVTFNSLPQTYGDLIIIYSGKTTGSTGQLKWSYNNSTVGYEMINMEGSGGNTRSALATQDHIYVSYDYSELSDYGEMAQIQVMDYTATDKKSPTLIRGGRPTAGVSASVALQNGTSAISSIEFESSTPLAIGSAFHIYGIEK